MKTTWPAHVTFSWKNHIRKTHGSATLICLLLILIAGISTACSGSLSGLAGLNLQTSDAEHTLSMNTVQHIQVCNKSGNVEIRTDPSVQKITVKSHKAVYTSKDLDQDAVNRKLQALTVHIQDAGSSECSWLSQNSNNTTLTVTAVTPDDKDLGKLYRDRINLEILLPVATIKQNSAVVHIEGFDQINLDGIGGNLQLTSLSGTIAVENSFMDQDSRLYSAAGDLSFSGALRGQTNKYQLISDSGDVTLTLPSQTNATLVADAPSGSITSDFDLKDIQETSAGAHFSGELNPGSGNTTSMKLEVRAGDGSITIHKS